MLFRSNSATIHYGGAVEAVTGAVSTSTFSNNQAAEYGGALYFYTYGVGGTGSITGSTFKRNSAGVSGGALALDTKCGPAISDATVAGVLSGNTWQGNSARVMRSTNNVVKADIVSGC